MVADLEPLECYMEQVIVTNLPEEIVGECFELLGRTEGRTVWWQRQKYAAMTRMELGLLSEVLWERFVTGIVPTVEAGLNSSNCHQHCCSLRGSA